MASTQYQVFCKYYNANINAAISNEANVEWVSAQEWYQCKQAYCGTTVAAVTMPTVHTRAIGALACAPMPTGTPYRAVFEQLKNALTPTDSELEHNQTINEQIQSTTDPTIKEALKQQLIPIVKYAEFTAEEKQVYDICNRFEAIKQGIAMGTVVVEHAFIRPHENDNAEAKQLDSKLFDIISNQLNNNNPKYQMIFLFDGLIETEEQCDGYQLDTSIISPREKYATSNPNPSSAYNSLLLPLGSSPVRSLTKDALANTQVPALQYEHMKRLDKTPWFLICTTSSLQAAMTKVAQLVKIYGKNAVKIGKVVPLEQYIDIV